MATPPTTGKRHPIWARFYARISPTMDAQGAVDHRRELLAGLVGRVLEVGAGNGLSFAHYPPAVTEVLAVEPEPYLRGLAEVAAHQAPVPTRVVDGTADALPAPDASMDAAVTSLVLSSVPDQARAWPTSIGCCGPAENCASSSMSEPTPRAGGCHTSRDTLAAITTAGFQITSLHRTACARPSVSHNLR